MDEIVKFFLGLPSVLEQGFILSIMVLGVYITYKILDFPDLSVDGTFPLGAFVLAAMALKNVNPFLALIISFLAGCIAGYFTGTLHVRLGITNLLSGILVMSALYGVNSRIVGRANIYVDAEKTIFKMFDASNIKDIIILVVLLGILLIIKFICDYILKDKKSFILSVVIYLILYTGLVSYTILGQNIKLISIINIVFFVKVLLDYLLNTKFGFALRALGDNKDLVISLGVNEKNLTIFGLMLSNGLVALAGALYAQYVKFADLQMGIGTLVIGLASIIIGMGISKKDKIINNPSIVIIGALIYQVIIDIALRSNVWLREIYKFFNFSENTIKMLEIRATDTKIITTLVVVAILAFTGRKLKIKFIK